MAVLERSSRPATVHTAPDARATTVQVTIARSDVAAVREFRVALTQPAVVLDALLASQRLDSSLGFRYSCRVAMCGTCAIRVNGRPTLACQQPITSETDELLLEPLAGFTVVRDLVVDTAPFWNAWRRVVPWFVPGGPRRTLPEGDSSRAKIERGLDCIACGACWSACDVVTANVGYLGPAALNRALTLVADERDGARAERLRIVSQQGGVTSCHSILGCTAACPKELDPSASIRRLRRWSLVA
jgi:succinate dehydrogenase / fumarate reductase iron-sulfur subunit/fumarate reductase iron-sulfur subunit